MTLTELFAALGAEANRTGRPATDCLADAIATWLVRQRFARKRESTQKTA
jgi:hypothetical protein